MSSEKWSSLLECRYRCTTPLVLDVQPPPRFHLCYVHDGSAEWLIGDRVANVRAGTWLLSDGTMQGGQRSYGQTSCTYTIVTFRPTLLGALETPVSGIDVLLPFQVLGFYAANMNESDQLDMEWMIQRMARFYNSDRPVEQRRLMMAFVELLVTVYAQSESEMTRLDYSLGDKERHVRNIMTYIEHHLNEDITLDGIGQQLHLSKPYISKLFRECTGMTIFDYLYRRRIEQARLLFVSDSHLSVTEVCMQVGFNNMSHFSTTFKTHVGVSPERYRKTMREEAAKFRLPPERSRLGK